ncbi:centrosomal protein of 95 kDa isoform X2 [Echinops telfairi]|uniref:Centrosomal protein of 95 kDa isoform X2 n=1 Tax=Echinops telfairi TaxID=9371 RepID=A0AC55DV25_ECHTE|nr:centrosomal protein of 95 kDa isoform X2 [Echinops telfairi]
MAGSEAEWVTIANNLLLKCHIHLRIHVLEDCDANVFIALYQSILGERVPDLIVTPRSQEDDAHNVQAVIDSLALDYLQVSLSHITGENIVKGDKESIKNLLEIFDGLLEYLTEHISETSHEKSEPEPHFRDSHQGGPLAGVKGSSGARRRAAPGRCSPSLEAVEPSWDEDEAESTGEIIRLGDTAHTFSLRSNGTQEPTEMRSRKGPVSTSSKSHEVLNPPSSFWSPSRTAFVEDVEIPSVSMTSSARKLGEPIRSAIPLQPPYHPFESRAPCPMGKEYLHAARDSSAMNSTGEYMVLAPEPDDSVILTSKSPKNEQAICSAQAHSPRTKWPPQGRRYENRSAVSPWDSPLPQRLSRRLTEQKLHAVSKKLSQRLSELDWMLKSALGDRMEEKTDYEVKEAGNEEVETGNAETLSQHSDSVMECGPKKPRPGLAMPRKLPNRSHSLSPSPVNKRKQCHRERAKQHKDQETDMRRFKARGNIYKEAMHKRTPKSSQPWKMSTRKSTALSPRGGFTKPEKAVPIKLNEYSLLPVMLEQFPFLHISGQTLSKMWKEQIAQIEQLRKDAYGDQRSKKKLQDEIEEALRRHDLLIALVKKEYEHNKRLQDFKDRINRQRLTQSKIKENRQQIVRARRYYDDYRVQLRAKMMRMRTREEMIFKKLFEEGLQIQKQRLRDLRNYAKEKRDEQKRQHQNELDSMENYYKDQFSLLAEAISKERQELKTREKCQTQTLHKVKRELRSKMEKEIHQLQNLITQNEDDAFFRELEAERFKSRLHLASFQYSMHS